MGDFGEAAIEALTSNDVEKLKREFAGKADINAIVKRDASNAFVYGGCSDFGQLQVVAGDTLLHLAMRNQKWTIRQACTVDLAADATIRNSEGQSPPGMHITGSLPRLGLCLLVLMMLYLEFVGGGSALLHYLVYFITAASFVDLFLGVRWFVIAKYNDALLRVQAAKGRNKAAKTGKKKNR